jgi:hypothetical protein
MPSLLSMMTVVEVVVVVARCCRCCCLLLVVVEGEGRVRCCRHRDLLAALPLPARPPGTPEALQLPKIADGTFAVRLHGANGDGSKAKGLVIFDVVAAM